MTIFNRGIVLKPMQLKRHSCLYFCEDDHVGSRNVLENAV